MAGVGRGTGAACCGREGGPGRAGSGRAPSPPERRRWPGAQEKRRSEGKSRSKFVLRVSLESARRSELCEGGAADFPMGVVVLCDGNGRPGAGGDLVLLLVGAGFVGVRKAVGRPGCGVRLST